jgi:addiction module RelB/DinJ family antitoxin
MGQTNISIRIDEDVKKDAEILFTKLGLTLSAATNVFYRQAIRAQGIPFLITAIEAQNQLSEDILARGRIALIKAQEQAIINGTSEMTLDDINSMISECRQGK